MSPRLKDPESARAEYLKRVGRAIECIDTNTGRNVSADEISRESGFAPSYIDRVLLDATGRTATQRIIDNKLDRAAKILASDQGRKATEVGVECGFERHSDFSKAFARKFGVTPSKWSATRDIQSRLNPKLPREDRSRTAIDASLKAVFDNDSPAWYMNYTPFGNVVVRLEEMNDMNMACIRFIGPYMGIGKAFRLLHCWAYERGLMRPDTVVAGMYHDIPETTTPDKLRSDACITVPPGTTPSVPVTIRPLACRGTYACGRFEFHDARLFPEAWKTMTSVWLPSSGFQFDDRPTFEIYRGDRLMLDNTFRVDICVPVKQL